MPHTFQNHPVLVSRLLSLAHSRHNLLMEEAKSGRGCDRHLFGLAIAAVESGRKVGVWARKLYVML